MKALYIIAVALLSVFNTGISQTPQLSEKAQISLITCAAGDVLYYAFGHTAFRVQDPVLGIDLVYNYGTFDFDKPNFYWNFSKGKLIYTLSRRRFENFLYDYELEKRWVKEQIFDLSQAETNQLFQFFEENYKPENRDYLYDPLFNNCSSITIDILEKQFGPSLKINNDHLERQYSFRELVRQFIHTNSWGAFGIDLAFGAVVDRTATVREHIFLPYYAMRQMENTMIHGKPLVKRERTILNYPESQDRSIFMTSPLFWFLLLFCFVSTITYLDYKHDSRSKWLDFSLFFISGIAGTIIALLWLATDHEVTRLNFNFLWLLPLNTVIAFKLFSNKKLAEWISHYLRFALFLIAISLILWIFGIQVMSPLNLLLIAILMLRYIFILKRI